MNIKDKLINSIRCASDDKLLEHIYTDILGNDDILVQNHNYWLEHLSDEENELFTFISLQENLFDDMCFDKDSIVGKYMIRDNNHMQFEHGLSLNEQLFRYVIDNTGEFEALTSRHNREIIINPAYCKSRPTILHEMIHAHEFIINQHDPMLKDILVLELYKSLYSKYDRLDEWIYNHSNIPHTLELSGAYGEHDLLFFLKSLDLDYRCNYEPFTVFGYDYTRNFREMGLL